MKRKVNYQPLLNFVSHVLQDFQPLICKNGAIASVLQSYAKDTIYSTQSLI